MKKLIMMMVVVMCCILMCSCNETIDTTEVMEPIHEFAEEIEGEVEEVAETWTKNDTLERELCEKFDKHDYCAVDYYVVDGRLLEYHTHSGSASVYFDGRLVK